LGAAFFLGLPGQALVRTDSTIPRSLSARIRGTRNDAELSRVLPERQLISGIDFLAEKGIVPSWGPGKQRNACIMSEGSMVTMTVGLRCEKGRVANGSFRKDDFLAEMHAKCLQNRWRRFQRIRTQQFSIAAKK